MLSDESTSTSPTRFEGRDRRRHPRAPADWPLQLALSDGQHTARVRDVSRAGVSFYLDRAIPMMTLLGVELDLPTEDGKRTIRGNGAVVRCERLSELVDHYEVAVFLHDMLQDDRDAIDAYVRLTSPEE